MRATNYKGFYRKLKQFVFFFTGWKVAYQKLLKDYEKLKGNMRATKSYYRKKVKMGLKKNICENDVLQYLRNKLGTNAFNIIKYQIKSTKKIVWDSKSKEIALSLYYMGPKSYRFLRTIIRLPSMSTLQKFINLIQIKTGFNEDIFHLLKMKTLSMNNDEKKCILLMDEISLKEGIQYSEHEDKIFGLVDYGGENYTKTQANCALVLMLRGINTKWKEQIAYFLGHNSISRKSLVSIIENSMKFIKATGLNLMGITTDQGSNFSSLFKSFGGTCEYPYAEINNDKILIFNDVPHLLKSTRNILYNGYRIETEEGIVDWKHIETCFQINNTNNFNMIPKISNNHIYIPKFGGKMKVSYASQVFSHSMSAAIKTSIDQDLMDKDAQATQIFCLKMNDLFDILNSNTILNSYYYKKAIHLNTNWASDLEQFRTWINSLKVVNREGVDKTKLFKCLNGWKQSILATIEIANKCLSKSFKWILTRNLCQDPLENLFGNIRQRGGLNYKTDCFHFRSHYKQLYFINIMKPPSNSNCQFSECPKLIHASNSKFSFDTPNLGRY